MNDLSSERIVVEVLKGGLRVVLGQHVITHFRSRKHAALLAYLACDRPGRRHSRGTLADLLWPDSTPMAARASLCEAISSLRSQIEPAGFARGSIILADRTTVALSASVETDYATLNDLLLRAKHADLRADAATAADLRMKAIGLFRDFLLPELHEGWLLDVQARLSSAVAEAECALASHFLKRGDQRLATIHAQKAFALDESCSAFSPELEALVGGHEQPASAYILAGRSRRTRAGSTGLRSGVRERRATYGRRPDRRISAGNAPLPRSSGLPLLAPSTRLFGRDTERERLASLLNDREARLITLAGPGGVGKTRLALAVAHDYAQANLYSKVWFVQMAGIADESRMCDHILRSIVGSDPVTERDAATMAGSGREALARSLNSSRENILLVLDNLEQISESAGELIVFLLGRVPGMSCLTTSRQRLMRPGERWILVDPLPTPPPDYQVATTDPEEFIRSWPSVELFIDRARQSAPNLRLANSTVNAIAALVCKLDGLPLAIELAAARSLLFTPRQMLEQVNEDRFRLLVDRQEQRRTGAGNMPLGGVSAESRHTSLDAAIAWSYNLLSPEAQSLLASLAIFNDGCTVAAAAQVVLFGDSDDPSFEEAAGKPALSADAFSARTDLLEQLCHASFLRAESTTDGQAETRFAMLETIREFARARLSADEFAFLGSRHARFYARLAEAAEPHLQAPDASLWMARLDRDYANLSAALDWAARTPTPDAARCGLSTATALHRYWLIRSSVREGRQRMQEALAHPCTDADDRRAQAAARNRAGVLAMTDGDAAAAEACYRETLALREALNDRGGVASVLNNMAISAGNRGDYLQARDLTLQALALWQALGDTRQSAAALSNLGGIDIYNNSLATAREFLTESVRLSRSAGDRRGAAIGIRNLGIVEYEEHNWALADRQFLASMEPLLELGDERGCAYSLLCLGLVAYQQGRLPRARRLTSTALTAYSAFGQSLPQFAHEEVRQLTSRGFPVAQPTVMPGTRAATAAIQAVAVLTEILLEGWDDTGDHAASDGLVLYTHPATAAATAS